MTMDNNNGRAPDGRFAKGNPGGPGNPYTRQMARFRRAYYKGGRKQDFTEAYGILRDMALRGREEGFKPMEQLKAMEMFLTWGLGKPPVMEILEDAQPIIERVPIMVRVDPREAGKLQ